MFLDVTDGVFQDGVGNNQRYSSVPRTQKLALSEIQMISVPPKDAVRFFNLF